MRKKKQHDGNDDEVRWPSENPSGSRGSKEYNKQLACFMYLERTQKREKMNTEITEKNNKFFRKIKQNIARLLIHSYIAYSVRSILQKKI